MNRHEQQWTLMNKHGEPLPCVNSHEQTCARATNMKHHETMYKNICTKVGAGITPQEH